MIKYVQPENDPVKQEEYWINPIGGLGDTLMLSGVLKQHIDLHPKRQLNLVRRKGYLTLLKGHPAIKKIGHPPADARLLRTDYWAAEPLGANSQRAYQVLARAFGLATPVPESLFVPGPEKLDMLIEQTIPWRKRNLIFAPFSESSRKSMQPHFWSEIISRLTGEDKDLLILQVGRVNEIHIKGTYSLLGVTTPKQLIALLSKCDVVLAADNFIMHAAHLTGIPAVVLWGPTPREVYGYDEHTHIQAPLDHCPHRNECIGTRHPENYARPCPLQQDQCMNKIPATDVCKSIKNILTGSK